MGMYSRNSYILNVTGKALKVTAIWIE